MEDLERRIIITRIDGKLVCVYMIGERIFDALVEDERENELRVGDIYVGHVQNVVDNIRAAFVELQPGVMGFLPLDERGRRTVRAEQEMIVQVKKPATGTKDALLTTDIELVGRFCMVSGSIGADGPVEVNVSKKITDAATTERLRKLAEEQTKDITEATAVMIRTNAAEAGESAVSDELDALLGKWKQLYVHGQQRTCHSCLHHEPASYVRHINRYRKDRIDQIVTDCGDVYEELRHIFPDIPVNLYEDTSYPPDARYAVSTTLNKALERRVWLKSGANLIIDRTEAMTVIDVNTAKAVDGKRASETTFFKINLEAAEEVARQLRLRNLSGIILVDFIDMKDREHIDALIAKLRECLKRDPVKATYVDYTKLGLVEITRARNRASLYETWRGED